MTKEKKENVEIRQSNASIRNDSTSKGRGKPRGHDTSNKGKRVKIMARRVGNGRARRENEVTKGKEEKRQEKKKEME